MSQGLDADFDLTDHVPTLVALGYHWFGRYLDDTKDQPLDADEVEAIHDADAAVVSLSEHGHPTEVGYFTYEEGYRCGLKAQAAAEALHQPREFPIYFTVDYDASGPELTAIKNYFNGVRAGMEHTADGQKIFAVGVYGSGAVCRYLSQLGLVSFTWLAQSRGWMDYHLWLTKANVVQGSATSLRVDEHHLDVDTDTSDGNGGGW